MDDLDGARGVVDHVPRNAPFDHPPEAGVAAGADDDEVRAPLPRLLDNGRARLAVSHRGLDGETLLAQPDARALDQLLGAFLFFPSRPVEVTAGVVPELLRGRHELADGVQHTHGRSFLPAASTHFGSFSNTPEPGHKCAFAPPATVYSCLSVFVASPDRKPANSAR